MKKVLFFLPILPFFLIVTGSAAPALSKQQPNVILISIDTLRADHLGCYGYDRQTSPAIDSLAKEGAVFYSAFSHSPLTTCSHMSMMTSLQPDVHKVEQGTRDTPGTRLDPSIPTIAQILKKAGYATAGFTGGGNVSARHGFDQGFDIYRKSGISDALAWIEGNHDKKFFLFLHTYAVHDPYFPSPRYNRLFDKSYAGPVADSEAALCDGRSGECGWYDLHDRFWQAVNKEDPRDVEFLRSQYDACVYSMDEEIIKPLLKKLRELGVYEDTILVFTADHGEAFNDHNNFLHGDVYAEIMRVPLIIVYAKAIPANKKIDQLVRLTDLMPTILELTGVNTDTFMQGQSLVGAMREDKKLGLACYSQNGVRALRTQRYTLIEYEKGNGEGTERKLFDRQKDPLEKNDILDRSPAIAAELGSFMNKTISENEKLSQRYKTTAAVQADEQTIMQLKSLGYVQ